MMTHEETDDFKFRVAMPGVLLEFHVHGRSESVCDSCRKVVALLWAAILPREQFIDGAGI